MATISNNTIVTLIDTQTNSGTVVLPKTSDIPYRAILFKDLYGTFDTKPLTLNTQSPDVFEDGTSVKRFNDKFSYLTLYADTSHSKWVILNGTQNNSITVSTLNGVQTGYISTLNVNSLTFSSGNGWLDLTALRAVLVSTIQLDAAIGNFSSISGNGSQIVALNAISSLSLQSTIVGLGNIYLSSGGATQVSINSTIIGLGTFGYLSTNTVPSTIIGLGTFGYLSTNTVPSTIIGLGTFGYLSTNTVPSTIIGLGTFGYLSTNTVPSTIVGLGTFGYLSTNTVPSTIIGLGTFGYISSTQLYSTVTGLVDHQELGSTIIGLGTFGYLSTNTVPSTIVGLGTFGYLSSFDSISSLNISTGNLFANIFTTRSVSTNLISSGSLITSIINAASYNGTTIGGNINMNGSVFPTTGGGVNRDLGSITNRWNNFFVSTISSIHTTTSTILVQNTITASTLNVGAATGTNLAFLNISTNSITGFSIIGTTILSTQAIFCSSLQIGPADAILDILGPLRTQDISTVTCQASTLTANTITVNGIFGGPLVANGTTTQNLNPFTVGAQIGFGSNTSQLGFYSEGHFRSTFTQVIQPTLDNDSFSNVVRINGNISSQNIFVSSIFGTLVSSPVIACSNLVGTAPGNAIYSQNFYPQGVNILGFGTGGPGNGPWDSASIRLTQTSSIVTNNISAGVINVSSIRGDGSRLLNLNAISSLSLESTIIGLGTFGYLSTNTIPSTIIGLGTFGYLSTNTVPSTIIGLGTFGYLSTNTVPSTIIGLGTFGYLSTNTVPSTIDGLGLFGYISSTQLTSTVTGLGNIYMSTFTGSTNFISSGQGFISTLNVNSLTFGPGNGWLDLTALRAVLVSTIQIDAAIGNFSSISGNGSQIVALNAISSLSLQSTIVGLGTFGYLSTNTVPSTIIGLGTFGYLSTNTVPSTIIGLGTFGYLSTNTVPSTIVGLGSFGYISSTQLVSTVIGLGNIYISTASGSASDWSLYPAITDVNLSYNIIDTVQQINVDTISSATSGFIDIINRVNLQQNRIAGVNDLQTDSISANNYGTVRFDNTIDMNTNNINNANTIQTENITSFGGTITVNNSHLIPLADDSYDLGSATNRWKKLYVGGTSIHLGNTLVLSEDIDGKLSTNAMIVSSINVGNISTGRVVADTVYSFSTLTSTITTNNISIKGIDPETNFIQFFKPSNQEFPTGAIGGTDGLGFYIYATDDMLLQAFGDIGITGDTVGIAGNNSVFFNTSNVNIFSNANISSINTNFISTNSINLNTIQTEYITSAGGTVSTTSHLIPSFDDTYDLGSATNRWRELYVAGTSIHLGNSLVLSEDSSGRLSTNKGIITSGLDLDNNAISNVLQTSAISSATTNLCLPTYKLITTTKPNTYNNSNYTAILVNPNYFTHVIPFNKYRVQLNFNGIPDVLTAVSYFYFTLSNYNSTVYLGSLYSDTRPYSYIQGLSSNTAFNFTDLFDMSAKPPNIGDSLYVILYAKSYDDVVISYTDINCFVITEPVV